MHINSIVLVIVSNNVIKPKNEHFLFQISGKGGKNRRRGKNENENEKRELVFKEDGQGIVSISLIKYYLHEECRIPLNDRKNEYSMMNETQNAIYRLFINL